MKSCKTKLTTFFANKAPCINWLQRRFVQRAYSSQHLLNDVIHFEEQGWGLGQWCEHRPPNNVVGFKSQHRRHMWVAFVVGFFRCSEWCFSGYSGFPLSSINQHFQIPVQRGMVNGQPLCGCATSKSLFILFILDL